MPGEEKLFEWMRQDNSTPHSLFLASYFYQHTPVVCYQIIKSLLQDPLFTQVNDLSPMTHNTAFALVTLSFDPQIIRLYMQYQKIKSIDLVYTGTRTVIAEFEKHIQETKRLLVDNPYSTVLQEKVKNQLIVKRLLADIVLCQAIEQDDVALVQILHELEVDVRLPLSDGTQINVLLAYNRGSQRVSAFIEALEREKETESSERASDEIVRSPSCTPLFTVNGLSIFGMSQSKPNQCVMPLSPSL